MVISRTLPPTDHFLGIFLGSHPLALNNNRENHPLKWRYSSWEESGQSFHLVGKWRTRRPHRNSPTERKTKEEYNQVEFGKEICRTLLSVPMSPTKSQRVLSVALEDVRLKSRITFFLWSLTVKWGSYTLDVQQILYLRLAIRDSLKLHLPLNVTVINIVPAPWRLFKEAASEKPIKPHGEGNHLS